MMNSTVIKVYSSCLESKEMAQSFSKLNGFEYVESIKDNSKGYYVHFSDEGIFLVFNSNKTTRICVDFVSGGLAHRRKFGGGAGQSIAKAVGLNKRKSISILDATAGLGKDSFVLATLGCRMTLIERSPIAYLLLKDGLNRAQTVAEKSDPELLDILARMDLCQSDSCEFIKNFSDSKFDVVYLDPMFPERSKSAAVKKEMAMFHEVIGADDDADELLEPALEKANHRVVVKRPKIAPFLGSKEPNFQLIGKSSRFDIYTIKAF